MTFNKRLCVIIKLSIPRVTVPLKHLKFLIILLESQTKKRFSQFRIDFEEQEIIAQKHLSKSITRTDCGF